MLNKEKYEKEILEIACSGDCLAINKHTNKLCACEHLICTDCKFNSSDNCSDVCKDWCNSEYREPEVDWSKVPVDTPIYVRFGEDWHPRYFARSVNNGIYHFNDGKTSFTTTYSTLADFDNVKLARPEDIEKYIK